MAFLSESVLPSLPFNLVLIFQNLSEKGVNVTQIEYQTTMTEDKIAELDKKLEELPETRENLVTQYKIEKIEILKANENRDYIGERKDENVSLFKASEMMNTSRNSGTNNNPNSETNQKEKVIEAQVTFTGRKR